MKRLYIVDLDGTLGLFHLFEVMQGRMVLRPGIREALEMMGDARKVIATRADAPYLAAVRKLLEEMGIVFDAYYSRDTVVMEGFSELGYFKHYDQILEEQGLGPEDQAVVIGDMMHFHPGRPYPVRQYRKYRFRRNPDLPVTRHSCCDHPTDPRILYAVIPQVLTYVGERVVSLALPPVVAHLERMWQRGEGDLLAGFLAVRRWDWRNDYLVSDALMRMAAFQIEVGRRAVTRSGRDVTGAFEQTEPAPHHYLFYKGRRRDWHPAPVIHATLEVNMELG